ncbi:MAG TPA: ATP-binding protein [Candidatus Saccharimonadales bacterium]|nr:ATP-binding protein [Candidatus Saccharimonadales bacterium]
MNRSLAAYVTAVVAVAVAILAVLTFRLDWTRRDLYLTWLLACLLAEHLWLSSITGKGSHSMVSTFNFVVIALLPAAAATWIVSLAALIASFIFQKRVWYRALFNGAQMVIVTALASLVFHGLGGELGSIERLRQAQSLLAWLASALVYQGLNTGLVAGAIALQTRQSWRQTWRENFGYRDELLSWAALFLLSPVALAVFLGLGFWGLILFYVPLLFIRDAHVRYIDLVRAQEALILKERMAAKGDIAAKIAHDLGNYLAPIMARAQMLILDANKLDPEKVARYAQIIFENGANMKILTRDLSDFSYNEVQMMSGSLNQLVRQTVEFVRPQGKFQKVQFQFELDESLPQIPMDPARIQQVLMNLLSNAADALEEAGTADPRVVVRTGLDSGGVTAHLEVADNGPGIAPENLSKVFEPRFSTKGLKGHGFGLATSFNILQGHRGRLTVASPPGGGATFTMFLPVRQGKSE